MSTDWRRHGDADGWVAWRRFVVDVHQRQGEFEMAEPQTMPLFTVQLAVKKEFYKQPGVTLVSMEVFATSKEEAETLARGAIYLGDRWDVDDIMES